MLDGLSIDHAEISAQRYGPSTAAAVLTYKKKRAIINRSYQNAEDNIVGKMTIASLDKELSLRDALSKPPGDCMMSPPGLIAGNALPVPAARFSGSPMSLTASNTRQTRAPKQLGGFVRVYFAITLRSALEDGFPLSAEIERARDCLFEHGISLFVEIKNGFADTLRFNAPIVSSFGNPADNVDDIRAASEIVRPGLPGVLRVIVCQMSRDRRGETFRNRRVGDRIVPPFILLNSQEVDTRSHATLIHEMIHASKTGPVSHDPEPGSVFFEPKAGINIDRTVLKPEHALTISTMSSRL